MKNKTKTYTSNTFKQVHMYHRRNELSLIAVQVSMKYP